MNERVGTHVDLDALLERTRLASTPEACQDCLPEIARALELVTASADRARLLICRARVRSFQSLDREACEDAVAAMALFEMVGDTELALDAASLAAAHASLLGNVSLASDLATKSILGLESVNDDRLRMEISNRLGIFCYYYLDYDRAVEQFELSLAAAERIGDGDRVCRELYNIADSLLLAAQQQRVSHLEIDTGFLERAEAVARRLLLEAAANPRLGNYRLLAQVLCELDRVDEALQVLDRFWDEANADTPANHYADLTWVEARCLRLAGRVEEALAAARRDVRIIETSDDEHDLMLALEELAACEEAAGDLQSALAHTREVAVHMWAIHQRQTRQLVQQVWARVDMERDRTSLQAEASEAARSADEDALTGIGNRRVLERFLRDEAATETEIACVIVDIDSFKAINDTFGHDIGDAVLCQIGRLLSTNTRPGQVAVRYGGDEFVVAMPGVAPAGAHGFAERLRLAVCNIDWTAVAPDLHVTVSLGVACGPAKGWPVTFTAADGRLLAAKRQGRNAVVTSSTSAVTA
ncbi:MAG TPA: GGDEF domain-containing protein [Acidothermaceae bacterium]